MCNDMLRCQFLLAREENNAPRATGFKFKTITFDGDHRAKVHRDLRALGLSRRASSRETLTPSLRNDLSCQGGFPTARRHHQDSLRNADCV